MRRIAMAVFTVGAMLATPAQAGIGDSAIGSKVIGSVPGVINNGLVTVISCTSASTASQTVGVDWYRKNGTLLGSNSLSVAAGETVNFATAFTAMYGAADAVMPLNEALKNGSARVTASSTAVVCNAYAIDPGSDPPARMMQLNVTGWKKQKN